MKLAEQPEGQGVEGGTPKVGHPEAWQFGPARLMTIVSPEDMVYVCPPPDVVPTVVAKPLSCIVVEVQPATWIPITSPPNPAPHPLVWSVIRIEGVVTLGCVTTEPSLSVRTAGLDPKPHPWIVMVSELTLDAVMGLTDVI